MVISTGLKFCIHSCIESTSTIFILKFLLLFPLVCDLFLACLVLHNIVVFVLGVYSTYERKHAPFGLLNMLSSLKMIFSSSIHFFFSQAAPLSAYMDLSQAFDSVMVS
jgi:hypothetical protein